jgi:hypothetical protein
MPIARSADNPAVYGAAQYPDYTSAGASKFIPELWSGKLLEKFYGQSVFGEVCNTDYEGEIKQKGDKVIIRQVPDVSITDYEVGDTITYEDLVSTTKNLTIDHAKLFAFKLDNITKIQSDLKLFDAWTADAAEQMKKVIDAHVLATVYTGAAAANAGATAGKISGNINLGTAAASLAITKENILDWIVDMGTVLDEQDVPENGRFLIIPAALAGKIKKSDLKDASITGDGTSALRNGRLGEIDRFTLYTSNRVAVTSGKYNIIAGTNHAISFASQFTNVEHLEKLERTFGSAMRGLNVYGFAVLRPEALVHSVVTK